MGDGTSKGCAGGGGEEDLFFKPSKNLSGFKLGGNGGGNGGGGGGNDENGGGGNTVDGRLRGVVCFCLAEVSVDGIRKFPMTLALRTLVELDCLAFSFCRCSNIPTAIRADMSRAKKHRAE